MLPSAAASFCPPSFCFLFTSLLPLLTVLCLHPPPRSSSVSLSHGQMHTHISYSEEEILKRGTPLLYNLEGRGMEGEQEVGGGRDEGAKGELWVRAGRGEGRFP